MDKNKLIIKIKEDRSKLDELFKKIMDKQQENEVILNNWSLKDVIAHLSYYENEVLILLQNKTLIDHKFWNTSINERNKMIYNFTNSKSLETIINDANTIFNKIIAIIENMTENELEQVYPGMTRKIGNFVSNLTSGHYEEHDHILIKRFRL